MYKIGDKVRFYGCRKNKICPCSGSACVSIGLKIGTIARTAWCGFDYGVKIPGYGSALGVDHDAIINSERFTKHKERLMNAL